MGVYIKTTEDILRSLGYLRDELAKNVVNFNLAVLFLTILWYERHGEHNEVIRPIWSYAIPDFEKYLKIFKKYNLITSGRNSNVYSILLNFGGSSKYSNIKDLELQSLLEELVEQIPELQPYLSAT